MITYEVQMVEDSRTRTVRIKLDVDESAADLLHQTTDHFLDAANYVVDVAWEPDWKITSKQKLHDLTYYDVRDDSPLPANLVQAARNRAAEAVKGVVERWKEGKKASKPHFTSRFASYDARTVTVNDDHATLATIDGRVTVGFVLPDEQRDTPHSAYLFNDDYDVKGATLHYDMVEDCFYLHVRTKPAVENDDAEQGDAKHVSVLGVDLGITNIATTSTGRFWSGGELNHWHREYEKLGPSEGGSPAVDLPIMLECTWVWACGRRPNCFERGEDSIREGRCDCRGAVWGAQRSA